MPPSKSIPVHMKHTKNDNRFRDANGETGHDIIQRHKQDYGVDLNELNVFEDPIPYFRWFLNRIKETCVQCLVDATGQRHAACELPLPSYLTPALRPLSPQ